MTFEDVYTVTGYSFLVLLLVVLAIEMVRDHKRAKRERAERNNPVNTRLASVTLPLPKDARITTVDTKDGRDGAYGVPDKTQVLQGEEWLRAYEQFSPRDVDMLDTLRPRVPKPPTDTARKRGKKCR